MSARGEVLADVDVGEFIEILAVATTDEEAFIEKVSVLGGFGDEVAEGSARGGAELAGCIEVCHWIRIAVAHHGESAFVLGVEGDFGIRDGCAGGVRDEA